MPRRLGFGLVVVFVLLAMVAIAPDAQAATVNVAIKSGSFDPSLVKIGQGTTVTWQHQDVALHTTTSDNGFWDSGAMATGDQFSETDTFESAGSYGYHCTFHGFTGDVRVRLKASGAPADGWKIRWSSLTSTPANRAFDVQIKRPGSSTWETYRSATTQRLAFFNPAKVGDYSFRARTLNLDNAQASDWSPPRVVTIS